MASCIWCLTQGVVLISSKSCSVVWEHLFLTKIRHVLDDNQFFVKLLSAGAMGNICIFTVGLFLARIVHFTVVCLVAKPLNRSEANVDLVTIQTLLLFKCKLLCYHTNLILVSMTTRSPSASLQIKGLASKYTALLSCYQ